MKSLPDIPNSSNKPLLKSFANTRARGAFASGYFAFFRTGFISKACLFSFLAFFLFALPPAFTQNRKDLEARRKQLIEDIKQTSTLLNKTAKTRTSTYQRYVTLRSQIQAREELIQTLQTEVAFADSNIIRTTEVVESLTEDIARLEEEYGMMARKAYRLHMSNSRLLFLFSADSFNDAFRRWQYIRQYDQYRQKQARLIVGTKTTLSDKIAQIELQKLEKQTLLETQEEQKKLLENEMTEKVAMLKSLRNDEDRLRNDLASKRTAHQQLNTAIENTIRQEITAQRKRARQPEALAEASASKNSAAPASTDNRASVDGLTSNFNNNRGRLPWPVKGGVITSRFGKQPHPTLKNVEITNNGIDIRTQAKASVQAIFNGEVVGVQFIPGFHNMVILRHGNYYSVYSNLEVVQVKRGDLVNAGQIIGRLAVDQSGSSEVHFEIWRDKIRLNPADWVKR